MSRRVLGGAHSVLASVIGDRSFCDVGEQEWDELRACHAPADWQDLALYVSGSLYTESPSIRKIWDKYNIPDTPEKWRQACVAMLRHRFATPAAASVWARELLRARPPDNDPDLDEESS